MAAYPISLLSEGDDSLDHSSLIDNGAVMIARHCQHTKHPQSKIWCDYTNSVPGLQDRHDRLEA